MLPLARLGVQLILLGDCENQLLVISDTGPTGEDLTRDISDSVMLRSCVGGARLTLTESHRSDQVLFDWYSSLAVGGSRYDLPWDEVLARARRLSRQRQGRLPPVPLA